MLSFQNLSFWEKETFLNTTDYLIVGSGIVGLSTAIYIKQRDGTKKVTLLERGILPTGASTKNAGFACIGSPSEILDDLGKMDESDVFDTVERRWRGLLKLQETLGRNRIGYHESGSYELFSEQNESLYETCVDKLDYLNRQLMKITGKPLVYQVDDTICKKTGVSGFTKAISHAAEGQIDTGKMMRTLLKKACELDVDILNGIDVQGIKHKKVRTNMGTLDFEKLIICTNGFSKRFFPEMDVEPARAQVIVTSPLDKMKIKGIYHFDRGYYYFRDVGNRLLFGGGRNQNFEAEKTEEMGTSTAITNHLEEILRKKILPETEFKIEYKWAGVMGIGQSKSPIIKEVEPNIFCGIRLGGMGVAIGTLVGQEIANMVTGH